MKGITLHDKETGDIIGTVILINDGTFDMVSKAWDKFQETHTINDENIDIYDFVSDGNWDFCEVLDLDFYQP